MNGVLEKSEKHEVRIIVEVSKTELNKSWSQKVVIATVCIFANTHFMSSTILALSSCDQDPKKRAGMTTILLKLLICSFRSFQTRTSWLAGSSGCITPTSGWRGETSKPSRGLLKEP